MKDREDGNGELLPKGPDDGYLAERRGEHRRDIAERRREERYCRKLRRGELLPKGPDDGYLNERRGDVRYCRKDLITGA